MPSNYSIPCRISGNFDLINTIDLGNQHYCGHFPTSKTETVPKGQLELGWSPSSGLLQLSHELDISPMYGENYGYRSGLNQEMVRHLQAKVNKIFDKLIQSDNTNQDWQK